MKKRDAVFLLKLLLSQDFLDFSKSIHYMIAQMAVTGWAIVGQFTVRKTTAIDLKTDKVKMDASIKRSSKGQTKI